jgi:hypothetical protein
MGEMAANVPVRRIERRVRRKGTSEKTKRDVNEGLLFVNFFAGW